MSKFTKYRNTIICKLQQMFLSHFYFPAKLTSYLFPNIMKQLIQLQF